jgi:hypothetical protein
VPVSKSDIKKDVKAQSADDTKIGVEDHTDYESQKFSQAPFTGGTIIEDDEPIDIDPSDIEMQEAGGDVIEVEIEQYPPAIVEAAEKAYDNFKYRGYGDWEDLLSDIDIETKDKAEKLGPLVIANRVWKASWKSGFMEGALQAMEDKPMDKDEKREKHIVGLKSFVLLLTRFFNRGCDEALAATESDACVIRQMRDTVLDSNNKVPIDEISKIFNAHERKQLSGVGRVISEAEQYKK